VLDVATGTGALASALIETLPEGCSVVGCDLNNSMLAVAHKRLERKGLPLTLVHCDAMHLPFADESFDAATIAFAIDDVPDRVACAQEIFRVLRPGGQLALLELSQPDSEPLRSAYRLYLKTFGRLRTKGYEHLAEEILTYRGVAAIADLLGQVGFTDHQVRSLTGGIARLHLCSRTERVA
jgi:demethylmenaquinone methyltransferase/2-methoxy-6-polyprenyl-1,4-benzoquinol methylase